MVTRSKSFGTSERISHDSSDFYNLKINDQSSPNYKPKAENKLPNKFKNKILYMDSRKMTIPNETVHLVITSPPYATGKDYDANLTLEEYLKLLEDVFRECYRVLVDGGRICINIANVGRKPYVAYSSEIDKIMKTIGFMARGQVIWEKGASAGISCSWGSWISASNPVLRDTHEYIMIYSKNTMKRNGFGREPTITRDEFMLYTKSVWYFLTVSAKKVGHPAPFPLELPLRCMKLYSFEGDVVLDPFCGSGQTAIASVQEGRVYVGFDNNKEYVKLAKNRLINA